jgi:1,4-dihydroxy-6-naphthoate synthase
VLIHEGRFTYAARGLQLVADLGVEWERVTGLPLPLGAIVADRSLPSEVFAAFEELLRRSIEYAFAKRVTKIGSPRSNL